MVAIMDLAGFKGQFNGWTEERRWRLTGKLISAIRRANAIPIGSVVSVRHFNGFAPRLRSKPRGPRKTWRPAVSSIWWSSERETPCGR
jgi:hypothetical protein